MGLFDEVFHECAECKRRYHQQVMIQTTDKLDHLCIRCFNRKKNEKANEKTTTSNSLSSTNNNEDKKAARSNV